MEQHDTNMQARLEWMERLVNTMSGIVYVYNAVEHRNVYANQNMGALLGYTPEELQAMGSSILATIMHPDDRAHLPKLIEHIAAAADSEVVKNEYRLRSATGEWIWFEDHITVFSRDAQGNLVEFVGVLQDITERKQQEQTLRMTQFTLDHAVDSIHWITLNGKIVYANDTACANLGYTRQEMLSMRIFDIDPFFTEEMIGPVWEDLRQRKLQIFEAVHRSKDGHTIPVEVVSNFLEFEGQEYACTFARDISERKHVEKQLRLAQFAMDRANDSIHWVKPDGTIEYVNDAACAMLDYTREELLGMRLFEIDPYLTEEQLRLIWEDLRQRRLQVFEAVHRHKDGHDVPVEITSNILEFEGQEYACSFSRDISERKRAEYELRLAKFTLDRSVDMIHWLSPDAEILYANDAACAALGYTPEELVQKRIFDIDPVFPEEGWAPMWRGLKQRGFMKTETMHRHQNGHMIPIEVTGNYLEFEGREFSCVFSRDITERKRQEAELRIFKALVENAPDGVCVINPTNYCLSYVNRAYQELVQYDEQELIGMQSDVLVDLAEVELQAMIAQLTAQGIWQGIVSYRRKDGSRVATFQSLFYIADEEGTLQASAVIARDITDQQRQEAERAALQQQVIDAQRATLRELSTPLIPIADEVVIMPLIGTIDSQRAQQIMEALLEGVARQQATLAILDITGVQVVDTQVADALIRAAQAVRLLGVQVMLTGIQPQIAQTLVHLGVDLSGISTKSSLQAGIAAALNGQNRT